MLNFNIYVALFFEGISVFMALFFFIQYIILKKKEHLFYGLYLFVVSLYYLLAIPNLFFAINDDNWLAGFLDMFKRPVQFFTSIFYTYFVIHYLGIQKKSSHLYRFFRGLITIYFILSFACLACNVFKIPYDKIFYLVNMLIFPVQFYTVIALLRHRVDYSKYIIYGTAILLIGSSVTLLISMFTAQKLPRSLSESILVFLPVQLCIIIDMFLFTIALQKKIADNEKSLINTAYQRQNAVLVERERIIADLHDDVGGGLSSISMMSELMAHQGNTSNTAHFAQKISTTAKDIAQRMHTIIWSLNAENDTLDNFIEYVRQYGVSFFENSGIDFQCDVDSTIPTNLQLKGVQRKNLFLIMKEAFHNILKHAGAKKTDVHIYVIKNRLYIEVKDNGNGIRDPNQFGNGLKNMKKRMDEIDGKLAITSNGGTVIKIDVELM
jgi:signal transduction histidine kinase